MIQHISKLIALALLASPLGHAAFYNIDNLPDSLRPTGLDTGYNATHRFGVFGKPSHCSSFFVSNSGHMITNLHCIDKCFRQTWDYDPVHPFREREEEHYSYFEVEDQIPYARSICSEHTNHYIWALNAGDPEYVWLGRGRGIVDEDRILDMEPEVFEKFPELVDDYVVMKYELEPGQKTDCVKISEEKGEHGDPIWAIGYPTHATRPGGFDSGNHQKSISAGTIRESIRQDPILQEMFKDQPDDLVERKFSRLSTIFDQDKIIRADLDAFSGNSGGLMMNQKGEAMGVAYSITRLSPDSYNHATLFGIRLTHIRDEITKGLGEDAAHEIFDCQTID